MDTDRALPDVRDISLLLVPLSRGRLWQELAQKEALAWEGYAGAVGDDYEETASALRKSERLLVRTIARPFD